MSELDDAILICATVRDQPRESTTPGSEVRWCHLCASDVWMSVEGLEFVAQHPRCQPTCIDCAEGLIEMDPPEQILPVPGSPRTVGELWDRLQGG